MEYRDFFNDGPEAPAEDVKAVTTYHFFAGAVFTQKTKLKTKGAG